MADWNLEHVNQPLALRQLPKKSNGRIDWGPVRVAHLDTGYTEHPAFAFDANGKSPIVLTDLGKDFLNPRRRSARDPLTGPGFMPPGHGTRSGSALCADGAGFTGIAPGLPLVPCRVTESSLITRDVARAIGRALDHVTRNDLAPVVSISLGTPIVPDTAMGEALDRAYGKGIIVVCAAGQLIDQVTYPAKHRRAIGVAGIQRKGRKHFIYYKYARYGRIDVWAPADPIRRANVMPEEPDEQFGDGTTYAAVHVSAAACMWLRKHGAQINQRYGRTWKRVEAFRVALSKGGRTLPFKSPDTNRALGLDCNKLLRTALPDPSILIEEMDLAGDDLA